MSKCWIGLILFNFAEPPLTSFCHNWDILMPFFTLIRPLSEPFYPLSRYEAYVYPAVVPAKRAQIATHAHAPS